MFTLALGWVALLPAHRREGKRFGAATRPVAPETACLTNLRRFMDLRDALIKGQFQALRIEEPNGLLNLQPRTVPVAGVLQAEHHGFDVVVF